MRIRGTSFFTIVLLWGDHEIDMILGHRYKNRNIQTIDTYALTAHYQVYRTWLGF